MGKPLKVVREGRGFEFPSSLAQYTIEGFQRTFFFGWVQRLATPEATAST